MALGTEEQPTAFLPSQHPGLKPPEAKGWTLPPPWFVTKGTAPGPGLSPPVLRHVPRPAGRHRGRRSSPGAEGAMAAFGVRPARRFTPDPLPFF